MAFSPEQTARLLAIQKKVLDGTETLEDLKEGIALLRQDRVAAQHSSTASRKAKGEAAKVIDPSAILADLRSLGAKLASGPVA